MTDELFVTIWAGCLAVSLASFTLAGIVVLLIGVFRALRSLQRKRRLKKYGKQTPGTSQGVLRKGQIYLAGIR